MDLKAYFLISSERKIIAELHEELKNYSLYHELISKSSITRVIN
jgi:hypothetical protein